MALRYLGHRQMLSGVLWSQQIQQCMQQIQTYGGCPGVVEDDTIASTDVKPADCLPKAFLSGVRP